MLLLVLCDQMLLYNQARLACSATELPNEVGRTTVRLGEPACFTEADRSM